MSDYEYTVEWCRQAEALIEQQAKEIERMRLLESQSMQSRIKGGKFARLAEAKLSRQLLEAKQEIERLREQLQAGTPVCQECDDTLAEVERLQLRVNQLETECGHLQADVNGQLEEIDGLRGLNYDMKALLETAVDGWEGAEGDWMAFRLMPEWFEAANDLTLEQGDFDLNDL